MGAKSIVTDNNQEEITNDLPTEVSQDKMALLKAKMKKQQEQQSMSKVIVKKERSIKFGVLGTGQAGSRIAEVFHKLGYDSCVVNTASQDLKFIDLPESNKLLLNYGLGGAAKQLSLGFEAANSHRNEIRNLIEEKLSDSQVNILCLSLGGGSGAGSCEVMIDLLSEQTKPLVVITVLPMDSEDGQTKLNALETLAKLTKLTQTKQVHNLIVIDNAKLETIYNQVSQLDFFNIANKAIVEPLDVFNTLSAMPSHVKALDSMEWAKMLTDGDGLSIYGELTVDSYEEETAIAEAVINNLNSNLLAGGFDLKQSKYVGVIISANKNVWSKIPSSSITYAMAMINDQCGNPNGVFKGIYTTDAEEDVVKVYSMFCGLSLPESRVEQLKKETKDLSQKIKSKDETRNLSLKLDTGVEENVSAAQKVKDKIAAKSSAFGKLVSGVVDRRK